MINAEANGATMPLPTASVAATREFVGRLPLMRAVHSADKNWPRQLQLEVNSHIADFL